MLGGTTRRGWGTEEEEEEGGGGEEEEMVRLECLYTTQYRKDKFTVIHILDS